MGVVAIAAALAGQGAQAVSVASNASNTEEEADFVEFELDGKLVKGWLWRSPLNEGDEVEVAAEAGQSYFNAYGAFRPMDRTVALYPHCSRGRKAHWWNALKWWFYINVAFSTCLFLLMQWISRGKAIPELVATGILPTVSAGIAVFFALMVYSIARNLLPFVRIAEEAFTALGFDDPTNVDLVKRTKASRKPVDPPALGSFYFRY